MSYMNVTENLPRAHEFFGADPKIEMKSRQFLEELGNEGTVRVSLSDGNIVEDYTAMDEHLDYCSFCRFLRSHTAVLVKKALEE
jgi:hypothetical protein